MSLGSKHTIVSAAILTASIAFAVYAYRSRSSGPVHLAVTPAAAADVPQEDPRVLRVCADPNNLPFSNDRGEGFENQIANTIAQALNKSLVYYWHPQRRGFLRTTLLAGACDVVMGVPSLLELARVTRPYYRSSYVFVSRHDRRLVLTSLDDPRLRSLRIAIPITGEDYDNPPPARALAARHIIDNVHGYPVYGDYSQPHPSSATVDAVRSGAVDVAIAWGPIAGFTARQPGIPLDVTPVPDRDGSLPFAFEISMAVRRGDRALAKQIDAAIARRAREIREILNAFGVPLTNVDSNSGGD
jgi:quinoprotein dehydrogenase-associated probable ABC transporter substrate-binding protein